jgi:hypothetical protein
MLNNQRVYHLLVLDGCYPSRIHIDGVHRPQRIILGLTNISHRPKEIQVFSLFIHSRLPYLDVFHTRSPTQNAGFYSDRVGINQG